MSDDQQRKPKRYRFEVELDEALLEDALNGTLGQAATKLLKRITIVNKKENPLQPNGDNGDPAEPATEQSNQPKDHNKNEKMNQIIKKVTPRKLHYPCNQTGRIFTKKAPVEIDLINIEESSNESTVQITTKRRERGQRYESKDLEQLLITTNNTSAVIPEHQKKTFYQRPLMAAYYALHMIGITDDRKMYKEKSNADKRDKNKHPTLIKALQYVRENNSNFEYAKISEIDLERPGSLFNGDGRTKPDSLPEHINADNLWIIFRILYGRYDLSEDIRTDFVPLGDDSCGYAVYRNGLIISGTDHIWHVSDPFLENTVTAQDEDDKTTRAIARKKFEHRISEWSYPDKTHGYAYDVVIDNVYYVYHNPVATKSEKST